MTVLICMISTLWILLYTIAILTYFEIHRIHVNMFVHVQNSVRRGTNKIKEQTNKKYINFRNTYLKWEHAALWGGDIFSNTRTSWPCSLSRTVLASTSRKMRLKLSLSTRKKWQLSSLNTMVAALQQERHDNKTFIFMSYEVLL